MSAKKAVDGVPGNQQTDGVSSHRVASDNHKNGFHHMPLYKGEVNRSPFLDEEPRDAGNGGCGKSPNSFSWLPWRSGSSSPQKFIKKSYHVTNNKLKSLVGGTEMGKIRHFSLSRTASLETSCGSADLSHKAGFDRERTVLFDDGSSYSGEWKDGRICGRGVFLWANGDRFEGEWKDDLQHGQGTYASADGSVYYGGWKNGVKDGDGVFKPAVQESIEHPVVYLRKYENGNLVKNLELNMSKMKGKGKEAKVRGPERTKRSITLERPLKPGEVIYKGHHSYDLMRQLQLGIMYGIAQEGPFDPTTSVEKNDFKAVLVQNFPSTGDIPGFKYKDYLPKIFRLLRESFAVDNADYLVSLTGGPALREMPSPGASGCIFFLSEDDRFLIKSVRKEEMAIFLHFIKHYQKFVCASPTTLLVKFFGIYRVSPWFGNNARFVVMGNVLPTEKRMHRKYDLKGSSYKRTIGKEKMKDPNATLKDLDIDMKFEIATERYRLLMSALERDVNFLSNRKMIDYSLLLGVHFISWGENEWCPPGEPWAHHSSRQLFTRDHRQYHTSLAFSRNLVQNMDSLDFSNDEMDDEHLRSAADLIASANSVRDAARSSAASANSKMEFSTRTAVGLASSSINSSRVNAEGEGIGLKPKDGWGYDDSVGWATPAMAVQMNPDGSKVRQPVLLYFGIIDFLQKYNTRKKLEKMWKTTIHGDTVSVADPNHYALRFLDFMKEIFIEKGDQWAEVGDDYVSV